LTGVGDEGVEQPRTDAVAGMGVVTSLGQGKADNWHALLKGVSGIKTISRFPTDGLKTRFAGTVDFLALA
jgi:3-oxoacyl-[acyl-carrier-protein] synthase II